MELNDKQIGLERLEKLLAHMEWGTLSVDEFDFRVFRGKTPCGTCGCMGGELPHVFSMHWEHVAQRPNSYVPRLIGSTSFDESAEAFFGLDPATIKRLFFPGHGLTGDATRAEVAANLRRIVEEQRLFLASL